MDIKITVGIPTYNRPQEIKQRLVELHEISLCDFIKEILVFDNSSNYETMEVVAKIGNPKVRYSRNKTNIGFNGNIMSLYLEAAGDYIWYLGDDDEICPDIIGRFNRFAGKFAGINFFDENTDSSTVKPCADNLTAGDVENILHCVHISHLVLRVLDDRFSWIKDIKNKNTFPQISLIVQLISRGAEMQFFKGDLVRRCVGFKSKDLLKLYCIEPIEAILLSGVSFSDTRVIEAYSFRLLRSFLVVNALERVSYYDTTRPITVVRFWRLFGGSTYWKTVVYLWLNMIVRVIPVGLIKVYMLLYFIIRERSIPVGFSARASFLNRSPIVSKFSDV